MGGYGTYKFATQFPDLFARAQPASGRPGSASGCRPTPPQPGGDGEQHQPDARLAAQHPVPDLERRRRTSWCPSPAPTAQAQTFDDLGYRYEFDLFTTAEHLTLAINDQYAPAAQLPRHARRSTATRRTSPTSSTRRWTSPASGTVADHAYWLSGLRLRDGSRRARRWARSTRARRASVAPIPAANPTQTGPAKRSREATCRRCTTSSERRLGARAAAPRSETCSISTPRTWPRSSCSRRGRASAATAARRHHRRAR